MGNDFKFFNGIDAFINGETVDISAFFMHDLQVVSLTERSPKEGNTRMMRASVGYLLG